MQCPKCQSNNIHTQVVTETELKRKRNPVYYLLIGWWVNMFMWLFLTLPMLIIRIFKPKKYNMKTTHKTMATCQECGNTWTV